MALKTFNVDDELYKKFSELCKREGISMSKRVNLFLERELARIQGAQVPEKQPVKQPPKVQPPSRYC